jgi:ribosomal protein S18 acetylase RimI-like enzyme
MTLIYETGKAECAPRLKEVLRRALAHSGLRGDDLEEVVYGLQLLPEMVNKGVTVVAEDGDSADDFEIVAFAHARKTTDDDIWMITHFYVDPDSMGDGIGRVLWSVLYETLVRMWDVRQVIVPCDPGAAGFFERMGATRIGVAEPYSSQQPKRVVLSMMLDPHFRLEGELIADSPTSETYVLARDAAVGDRRREGKNDDVAADELITPLSDAFADTTEEMPDHEIDAQFDSEEDASKRKPPIKFNGEGMHTVIEFKDPHRASELNELAVRSKAFWGYDDDFMERCREELLYDESDVECTLVLAVETAFDGGRRGLVGFLGAWFERGPEGEHEPSTWFLGDLYVDPRYFGRGIGSSLWYAMAAYLSAPGNVNRVHARSDPNAVGFFEKLGFHRVGEIESSLSPDGRMPRMEIALADAGVEIEGVFPTVLESGEVSVVMKYRPVERGSDRK